MLHLGCPIFYFHALDYNLKEWVTAQVFTLGFYKYRTGLEKKRRTHISEKSLWRIVMANKHERKIQTERREEICSWWYPIGACIKGKNGLLN